MWYGERDRCQAVAALLRSYLNGIYPSSLLGNDFYVYAMNMFHDGGQALTVAIARARELQRQRGGHGQNNDPDGGPNQDPSGGDQGEGGSGGATLQTQLPEDPGDADPAAAQAQSTGQGSGQTQLPWAYRMWVTDGFLDGLLRGTSWDAGVAWMGKWDTTAATSFSMVQ